MAETIIEDKIVNTYGITPEMQRKAREKLERLIREKGIKRFTAKDFQRSSDREQTQEEIRAEVDEFLEIREQWRKENRILREERELDDFAG